MANALAHARRITAHGALNPAVRSGRTRSGRVKVSALRLAGGLPRIGAARRRRRRLPDTAYVAPEVLAGGTTCHRHGRTCSRWAICTSHSPGIRLGIPPSGSPALRHRGAGGGGRGDRAGRAPIPDDALALRHGDEDAVQAAAGFRAGGGAGLLPRRPMVRRAEDGPATVGITAAGAARPASAAAG